jgi:hypothetical protein
MSLVMSVSPATYGLTVIKGPWREAQLRGTGTGQKGPKLFSARCLRRQTVKALIRTFAPKRTS